MKELANPTFASSSLTTGTRSILLGLLYLVGLLGLLNLTGCGLNCDEDS